MTSQYSEATTSSVEGGENEPKVSRTEQFAELRSRISRWTFLNPYDPPWVLVENGSLFGFFNFIPAQLRDGPWSIIAMLVFATLMYAFTLLSVWMFYLQPAAAAASTMEHDNDSGDGHWLEQFGTYIHETPNAWTASWFYHVIGFIWTFSLKCNVYYNSPIGGYAFTTFTMWSWALMTVRHGLCVVAPFFDPHDNQKYNTFLYMAEVLRFPVLSTATIVFVVWNFVLMPIILFLVKDRERRKILLSHFFNNRLLQVHVGNIFAATINGAIVAPRRSALCFGDLYFALAITVAYMIWYYFILDRIGVHFYPIFSPRTPFVVVSWAMIFLGYLGTYQLWNSVLAAVTANDDLDFNGRRLLIVH